MKRKKVLVTGSNGMLGKDLVKTLKKNSNYEIFGINRTFDFDLTDLSSFKIDITNLIELQDTLNLIDPDIIVHCAAMIDVDACEKHREYAKAINIKSTEILASFKPNNTKFVFISTDSVFDGQEGFYGENDKKTPLNYYAETKSNAEEVIKKKDKSNSIIIRTNIYGFHKSKGKSLVEWALKELLNNNKILGFNDVYFNPLYTKQLARVIIDLIENNYSGTIHLCSENSVSKYDFLKKIALKFNINTDLIESVSVDDKNFRAIRPKNTTLSNKIFKNLFRYSLTIDDGIELLYVDYQRKGIDYNE